MLIKPQRFQLIKHCNETRNWLFQRDQASLWFCRPFPGRLVEVFVVRRRWRQGKAHVSFVPSWSLAWQPRIDPLTLYADCYCCCCCCTFWYVDDARSGPRNRNWLHLNDRADLRVQPLMMGIVTVWLVVGSVCRLLFLLLFSACTPNRLVREGWWLSWISAGNDTRRYCLCFRYWKSKTENKWHDSQIIIRRILLISPRFCVHKAQSIAMRPAIHFNCIKLKPPVSSRIT